MELHISWCTEGVLHPGAPSGGGQNLANIVEALDCGLSAAEDESGVRCSLILDFDRAYGPSVHNS